MDLERQPLRWQCRRGMLELDLMLGRFLDGASYSLLQPHEQADFRRLLAMPDQTLYQWLIGQTIPEASLQAIVLQIRQSVSPQAHLQDPICTDV